MEICLGVDDVTKESLSVVTKQQTSMGDIIVGVSYRLPDQDEQGDEVFYRHLVFRSWSLQCSLTTLTNTLPSKAYLVQQVYGEHQ